MTDGNGKRPVSANICQILSPVISCNYISLKIVEEKLTGSVTSYWHNLWNFLLLLLYLEIRQDMSPPQPPQDIKELCCASGLGPSKSGSAAIKVRPEPGLGGAGGLRSFLWRVGQRQSKVWSIRSFRAQLGLLLSSNWYVELKKHWHVWSAT